MTKKTASNKVKIKQVYIWWDSIHMYVSELICKFPCSVRLTTFAILVTLSLQYSAPTPLPYLPSNVPRSVL